MTTTFAWICRGGAITDERQALLLFYMINILFVYLQHVEQQEQNKFIETMDPMTSDEIFSEVGASTDVITTKYVLFIVIFCFLFILQFDFFEAHAHRM